MTASGAYLFLLGVASGVAVLTMTAYRRVSPAWLKWLLMASGALVIGRYLAMALFTDPEVPTRWWGWRHCWFGSSLGLTLPGVFAVDQLVRHPALSPKTLLRWFAPFLLVYGAIIVVAPMTPSADQLGWTPRLAHGWRLILSIAHGLFVGGFLWGGMFLLNKFPFPRSTRLALIGLMAGYGALALDGMLRIAGGWYFRPYLFTEMAMLAALWYAFETAAAQQ